MNYHSSFTFRPNTNDAIVFHDVVQANEYQLPDAFEPDDVIIDIGTHIGSFAYAALIRGCGKVFTFEANSDNVVQARQNLAPFGERVELFNKAVWRSDEPGALLYLSAPEDSDNLGGGNVWDERDLESKPAIETMTLNEIIDYATNNGARRIRLLKIDCEGSEFAILLTADPERLKLIDAFVGEYHEFNGPYNPWMNTIPGIMRLEGYDAFLSTHLLELLAGLGYTTGEKRFDNSHMGFFSATAPHVIPLSTGPDREGPMLVRPNGLDRATVRAMMHFNHYRLPPLLPENAVIVDVGAHIGAFAYAALSRNAAEVFAYEPNAEAAELARKNLAPYGNRAHVAERLVWPPHLEAIAPAQSPPRISLDEIIDEASQHGKRRINILKIACDGGELALLRSARKLDQVDAIIGSFASGTNTIGNPLRSPLNTAYPLAGELEKLLAEHGFLVDWVSANGGHEGRFFARKAEPEPLRADYFRQQVAALHETWSLPPVKGSSPLGRVQTAFARLLLGPTLGQQREVNATLTRIVDSVIEQLEHERARRKALEARLESLYDQHD